MPKKAIISFSPGFVTGFGSIQRLSQNPPEPLFSNVLKRLEVKVIGRSKYNSKFPDVHRLRIDHSAILVNTKTSIPDFAEYEQLNAVKGLSWARPSKKKICLCSLNF